MKLRRVVLLVLIGTLLGLSVTAYRLLNYESSKAFFRNGNWMGTTNLPLGKDALITAQITLFAMFALPSEEAVYLLSRRDNENVRFHSFNDYVISGNTGNIKAKYWSITAYGNDLFLIPNKQERYSVNSTNVIADSAGNFQIILSNKEHNGNWLPTPANAQFNLLLRIYKGESEFLSRLSSTPLPGIKINKP
jgi:hypothetical protein